MKTNNEFYDFLLERLPAEHLEVFLTTTSDQKLINYIINNIRHLNFFDSFLAKNPNISQKIIDDIFNEVAKEGRCKNNTRDLLSHQNANREVLQKCMENCNIWNILEKLYLNPNLDLNYAFSLEKKHLTQKDKLILLAQHPKVEEYPRILNNILNADYKTRMVLANNKHLSKKTQQTLLLDKSKNVKMAIVHNPTLHNDLKDKIIRTYDVDSIQWLCPSSLTESQIKNIYEKIKLGDINCFRYYLLEMLKNKKIPKDIEFEILKLDFDNYDLCLYTSNKDIELNAFKEISEKVKTTGYSYNAFLSKKNISHEILLDILKNDFWNTRVKETAKAIIIYRWELQKQKGI